jgi:hypothetical protein
MNPLELFCDADVAQLKVYVFPGEP